MKVVFRRRSLAPNDPFGLFARPGGVPALLQAEAAECGLACLAMVANAHGMKVRLPEMRRRFSTSIRGTNLKAIMDMAGSLGFACRAIRLEPVNLHKLKTPAILHWELKHFVVLKRVSGSKAWINDPATGPRTFSISEFGKRFSGVALELTPGIDFSKGITSRSSSLISTVLEIPGAGTSLALLISTALAAQVLTLAAPLVGQVIIDEAIPRIDQSLLLSMSGIILFIYLMNAAIRFTNGLITIYLGNQLGFLIQSSMIRKALSLPLEWFEKRHIGDIISRFESSTPIQNGITNSLPKLLLDSTVIIVATILMSIYSIKLATISLLTTFVLFSVRFYYSGRIRNLIDEGIQLSARVRTTFIETIRGARTFKIFGSENQRVSLWQNEKAELINSEVSLARLKNFGSAGLLILQGAQIALIWFIGAKLAMSGQMTIGMISVFMLYVMQVNFSVVSFMQNMSVFNEMRVNLQRLDDVASSESEKTEDIDERTRRAIEGDLAVTELSFRYSSHEPWIIRAANFQIRPGEFVSLSGPSGQGKTTLLKLLLGLYQPTSGEVLVDGVPIQKLGVGNFRARVGVVMQDDYLFTGTIADNICFFDTEEDFELIVSCARRAQIHDEIEAFPMGYKTLISDMGSSLSGGQRQRLFLARALYRQPDVLFLDEGTANMDGQGESRIMDVIRGLPITRVVVAHRPEAMVGATRRFWVQGGTVTEEPVT